MKPFEVIHQVKGTENYFKLNIFGFWTSQVFFHFSDQMVLIKNKKKTQKNTHKKFLYELKTICVYLVDD